MRIVLLEDELFLREEIACYLTSCGHEVFQAGTIEAFWPQIGLAHIAILDVMLPDGSGFDVLAQLRQNHEDLGIVMMTALGSVEQRLTGLDGGADHYMVKPVDLRELGAILQSLSRRLTHGWCLNHLNYLLITPEGLRFQLHRAEFEILRTICTSPGQSAERRAIVEGMGYSWKSYDLRRLDTIISRLRQRWSLSCSEYELPLRTDRSVGYRFSDPIKII